VEPPFFFLAGIHERVPVPTRCARLAYVRFVFRLSLTFFSCCRRFKAPQKLRKFRRPSFFLSSFGTIADVIVLLFLFFLLCVWLWSASSLIALSHMSDGFFSPLSPSHRDGPSSLAFHSASIVVPVRPDLLRCVRKRVVFEIGASGDLLPPLQRLSPFVLSPARRKILLVVFFLAPDCALFSSIFSPVVKPWCGLFALTPGFGVDFPLWRYCSFFPFFKVFYDVLRLADSRLPLG